MADDTSDSVMLRRIAKLKRDDALAKAKEDAAKSQANQDDFVQANEPTPVAGVN